MTQGHEFVGEVVKLGQGITALKVTPKIWRVYIVDADFCRCRRDVWTEHRIPCNLYGTVSSACEEDTISVREKKVIYSFQFGR